MLSRNILNWVVLLTLATVTRSEHYHIVPVDSTDLCNGYRNGTCFTLEQFVETDLLSGGDNLALSFLPGDHVLTEQLWIRNFSHVHLTGLPENTTVVRFHSNGVIRFVSITKLSIERFGFIGVNLGSPNSHPGLIVDSAHDVYINDCYFTNFDLLNQADIVKITNTQTATIESTLFMKNIDRALHIEADDVYITKSVFTRNDGGAVDIQSNNTQINNTEFNYNSAENGGAVEVISGTVVITWCNFTNNKASQDGGALYVTSGSSVTISDSNLKNNGANWGGAINVDSGNVSISGSTLINNTAIMNGGAVDASSSSIVSIFNSILTNNTADRSGGAFGVTSNSRVTISDSNLTNNGAKISGGVINVDLGSVSISGSTLTNNIAAKNGGAIDASSTSRVTIYDSNLKNNGANWGGAINVNSGNVSISGSTLTNNIAAMNGGAIDASSSSIVSIFNSILRNNTADGSGGAIGVQSGNLNIFDSNLTNNRAKIWGGAINVDSSRVSISDSILTDNTADSSGGAIDASSSIMSIFNSTLTNNSAKRNGGAIGVTSDSSVTISNSNLTNNRAKISGGAINVDSGNVSISGSTLTNNIAAMNGGAIDASSLSIVSIFNSILRNNTADGSGGAFGVTSGSRVTISDSNLTNNRAKIWGGAINVESGSVSISNNTTLTNNTADGSGGAIRVQSGNLNIFDSNLTNNRAKIWGGAINVDSGNVSISGSTLTNNIATMNGGAIDASSSSIVSIFNSILRNNTADGSGGAFGVTSSSRVTISDSNLTKNGAKISGGVINVDLGSVSISDSTLTNNIATMNGGAIDASSSSIVSIFNSILRNNTADGSGGAFGVTSSSRVTISDSNLTKNGAKISGGVINVDLGSVSISDSTLTNNIATMNGGAIDASFSSIVSIFNSILRNNTADESGGAFGVTSGSRVTISDSNLTNNRAKIWGGAINVESGSVSISNNTTLTNNTADGSGGAIGVQSGNLNIFDSNLTNNRAKIWGGVINVDSGNVSISGSTLINNSAIMYGGPVYNIAAMNGGAIDASSSSIVSIFNSILRNNTADGSGGAIGVQSGNLNIFDSNLTNNRANIWGGAINVDSSRVSISDSILTDNTADYGGAIDASSSIMFIFNSTLTNNSAKRNGGAIGVTSNSSVTISDSNLINNRAEIWGGAINIDSGNVSISDSILEKNSAKRNGGAIDTYSGSVSISNSTLTNNIADRSGGAIGVYSSSVSISDSTLTNNRAVANGGLIHCDLGSTVSISDSMLKNNTATSGGGIFLRVSTLSVNEPIKINLNTAHQDGAGIYAHSSRVDFQSASANIRSEIVDNIAGNGGGIYAVATTIKLTHSHVSIGSNTATASGGGVFLRQSSRLYLFKKDHEHVAKKNQHKMTFVSLLINNNSAQYGGGIFVADDTESGACRGGVTETGAIQTIFEDCFIQTINLMEPEPKINHFNTFMTNNTATQSGADIYGGLLDRCTAEQNAEYYNSSNGLDYIKRTVKPYTELSISSSPIQVTFCNHSQSDYVFTKKGHTYKINVMAFDQVGNPINATIRSSVITNSGVGRLKEGQSEQVVGNQCTELEYNVFSQDSSAQVELYADGPCMNLGISRQVINISFLPCTCPVGLKPIQSDIECKCDCDPDLQQLYQITNCSEENGSIKLESNNNIWIEFINTPNKTGYVVSNCAFDYCVEKPINISLSNPDEQCAFNRSGVLCGECEPGLSLVLATSNCKECSNLYLLLLIPFALAGILLVASILVLNITIATGNIHGLIFYANIVAANRAIFLPSVKNVLTVFVSWVNLDLGIETCFYDGMNSQGKALIQLVFPTYLFVLMLLIILLSKYFDSFAKLLSNRNPVAALGTLVLLSYSKFLRFIVAALQFTELHYPDGSTKVVWLYDGNVQYFTPIRIPQFVAAIIILIAGVLFTVLLFFGQWFPRCSKVMICTKNTYYNGFMDAYHAPFTPKHRYWVGLLLFALIVYNLVAAMDTDTSLPVLSAGCIAFGLIALNNRVYKKRFNEYLEALFLLNLGILSIGTSYVVETHQQQETLTIVSMPIAFILFVIIISYHFHHFILKNTKIWLKIKEVTRTGTADKKNQQPNNAMAMHQLAANDDDEQFNNAEQIHIVNPPLYTGGAVEEADPDRYITPPIIRPATRPEQLRLSYMDELAPITTENYRPAPLPQRVNRRPTVTHTEIAGPFAQ
ncbi:uncharacterized protein LOC135336917 [Halichondria panicea]|uniref:uncharacterized protein LOC135336917 n=1 Tax=Halichondria panicea TaxID=6063 RepID=UPI00312B3772